MQNRDNVPRLTCHTLLLTLAGVMLSASVAAQTTRLEFDVSARHTEPPSGDGHQQYAYGLDLHHVINDGERDVATILFQPYLVTLNDNPRPPYYFKDGDDTAFQMRYAYINYTGLSDGLFNIRAGHMEVPFGAEGFEFDTGGTLRQLLTNTGIKVDWGVSVNGANRDFEYEVAFTRGSGIEWHGGDDPYLVSGRIGTSSRHNHVLGVSFMDGDIWNPSGPSIARARQAVDYRGFFGLWRVIAELSVGDDNGFDRESRLLELMRESQTGDWQLYAQLRDQTNDLPNGQTVDTTSITWGLNWRAMQRVWVELQAVDPIDTPSGGDSATVIAQFRIRI